MKRIIKRAGEKDLTREQRDKLFKIGAEVGKEDIAGETWWRLDQKMSPKFNQSNFLSQRSDGPHNLLDDLMTEERLGTFNEIMEKGEKAKKSAWIEMRKGYLSARLSLKDAVKEAKRIYG